MRFRNGSVGSALVLASALLLGGWLLQQGVAQERSRYFQGRLFDEVMEHVRDHFVDPVQEDSVYRAAIEGALDGLDDPNTSFLDAREWENFRIRTEGEFGGIGIEISEREGWVTVISPIPGTPAARAGVRAGDRIWTVDGESAEGWSSDRAVDVLRGRPGTTVEIEVARPGVGEPIPFSIRREQIQVKSVPFSAAVEEGIGYVPLRVFSETTTDEVRDAMRALQGGGARGLILDLRGNLGGLLDQGVAITDLFLPSGRPVVETRGREGTANELLRTEAAEAFAGVPLVVLVDESSASASEIVAGALQDHDRALVIGRKTFGKGSVQTLYRLTGGNVLRLTTARWYTPSGRSIQKPFDEQTRLGEEGVMSLSGQLAELPDTVVAETVTSMAGRVLVGGGGITPDVYVLPDTLSTAEDESVRELYRQGGRFNTALFNFTVGWIQRNPPRSEGGRLVVPEGVVEEFRQALPGLGVEVDAGTFAGARRYVRYQLEREIALQAAGEEGEFRQGMAWDRSLQEAIEVLRRADTPESVFRIAGDRRDSDAMAAARVLATGTN